MQTKLIFTCLLTFLVIGLQAQVLPPEVRKFKFYQKKKVIKTNNKRIKISFQGKQKSQDKSIKTDKNNTYSITSERSNVTMINVKSKRKTMNIHAYFSLEHIPFQKGNFVIPMAYRDLFLNIKPHDQVKITNLNWENFKVKSLPRGQLYETINPFVKDTLQPIKAKFWQKNNLIRIREHNIPHYAEGFHYDKDKDLYYLWDDDHGYVSKDHCKNWRRIDYPETFIDSIWRSGNRGRLHQRQLYKSGNYEVRFLTVENSGDNRQIVKTNISDKTKKTLLTVNNAWYARLTVHNDIWCVSAQGYMLISTDFGATWTYYVGDNYNVNVFEIVNERYLFDGLRLYWVR